ncbi:hypothetical protein [Hymenobacter sp. CRA2]|uniref:hypothetical protein n=1 Tax=Hymenobacter sp. CRA2 TaxID=1955620 RepID=UPI00098EE0CB|nr:hypothetical protein [Hymenobacter sp. CRA2]OON67855.1 hypothetical protein B0919_16890 [Hymenobacter sp. CRA2]
MEALFHLAFTLVKIAVQASLYATLLLGLCRLVAAFRPGGLLADAARRPGRLWWASGFVLSGALFWHSFTYWGNHGLGDYSRVPLGHGEALEELNGTDAYFAPTELPDTVGDQLHLEAYQITDDVLCAATTERSYFTYDLRTKQYQDFPDQAAYAAFAAAHGLPAPNQFESFQAHYSRYWGGWRFWLLA